MLMARTSFAARGSGRRTVKVTSARGRAVAVGPVGKLGVEGLAVGKVGHFKSEIAQAWLTKARTMRKKRMRRERTDGDFITLLNASRWDVRLWQCRETMRRRRRISER